MRPEVANYQPQLDILIAFAEGGLDGLALDAALTTEEMTALLGVFEDPRYPALTNHYRRLLQAAPAAQPRSLASMKLFGVRQESRDRDYPRPREAASPPFVGRWGVLGYYLPAGLMPSDDAKRFLEGPHEGEVLYCCVAEDAPLVVVRNNAGREFRVNPERFIWVAAPGFQLGDRVATKVGTPRIGWVAARGWHYKECRVFYLIDIPGTQGRKRHSRRYWENELELHSADDSASGKLTNG
jgi:hypothetical protein